jgi:tetratricopeptide (TPR) repeat protein
MENQHDDYILESVKRFEEMLKTDTVYFFDSEEYALIARYYLDNGNVSKAEKATSMGLEQYPDNINLQIVQSEIYILHGKNQDALSILEELQHIEPENPELLYQLATVLSKTGKHREAISVLHSIPKHPDFSFADITFMLGNEYMTIEDFQNASLYFKETLRIDPADTTALYNLIYCYELLEDYEAGIDFLLNFIEDNPYNEVAWHQLGKQYYSLNKYDKALQAFDYALLIDEGFSGAYIEIAKIYEQKQLYHKALEYFLITEQLSEPSPYIFKHIAACYDKLGLTNKEIEYLYKAHESDPSDEHTILMLAERYFQIGESRNSLHYLDKLLSINENNPEYWKIYADANYKIKFYPEAIKAYKKYLSFNKHSLQIYTRLADAYIALGNYTEAINILGKAEVYYHNRAEIYFRLAGLQIAVGKKAYGLVYLNKALQINFSLLSIFKELFPQFYDTRYAQRVISEHSRF